jgi:serine/threonine-protein kinase
VVVEAPPTGRKGVYCGDLVGRKYVVDGVIGEGRTGVVVSAHHKELRTKAAIKIGRNADRESSARFQREAHAMARLESPYTVRVFDVGQMSDGRPYMVMEYLDGRDLGSMLAEEGPLPVEDTLRWMLQASEAIEEAHDVGILHRDLEPRSLLLARQPHGSALSPTIRVLDFGFAPPCSGLFELIDSGKARVLRPGDVPGTSYFMAPEQVRGARLDRRTDVWGLGATLFRLLTNRYPFPGVSLAEVCGRILGEPPASLRASGREIPSPVEAAVLRCLQKQPHDRFENMAALRTALREARDEMRNTPMVVAAGHRLPQRLSEPPPTPHVPANRVLFDEARPTPQGRIEAAPPSSDSATRVVGPALTGARAHPVEAVTIQRRDPTPSDTITITEPDTIVHKGESEKEPRRLALPETFDAAPTEVKRREAPSLPAGAAAASRDAAHCLPLEKLIEAVPVRLGARASVAKRPFPANEMPPSPFVTTAAAPDPSVVTPEPAEIVDLVETRVEERVDERPIDDDPEPSTQIAAAALASDRPSPPKEREKDPEAEVESAPEKKKVLAPRAPMHALHDYRPPRKRKAAAAAGVVVLAAIAIGASAWTLRGRQSQVETAASASTASRPAAASSSATARAAEPSAAAAGAASPRTSAANALASASAPSSAAVAASSTPRASASATASAVAAATTSEPSRAASEPTKTPPLPSPRPRVVRPAPAPGPTARTSEGDDGSGVTSRGGSTPVSTGTSSILDKRK